VLPKAFVMPETSIIGVADVGEVVTLLTLQQ